jgi:hypothetical protein
MATNPAARAGLAQDKRIPELDQVPVGTDVTTLSVPVFNPATNTTQQAPLGGPAALSNAIIGGPKFVQYRDSRLYGVPAKALTLDRLTPSTIVPGTLATVNNPADTPMSVSKPPQQYIATVVTAGIVGAVLVPRYLGAPASDTVSIVWQEVAAPAGGGPGGGLPLLSLVRDAYGEARFLLPSGYSTDLTKYRVVKKLRDPAMRLIDLKAAGVVADAKLADDGHTVLSGTDNAAALLAVRDEIVAASSFRDQPKLYIVSPKGVTNTVTYSKNYWANNWRWFILDLNGGTLVPTYTGGPDNYQERTLNSGELLQILRDGYLGTKFYMDAVKFETAPAGSTALRVKNPAELRPDSFFPGAWVLLYSKEMVLGITAYPPGTKHNERIQLKKVNYQTGEVELATATDFEHRDDNPENPNTSGGSGQARMLPLDDPRRPYCDYAEFRNGTMLAAKPSSVEAIGFVANEVVYRNIISKPGGPPTESITSTTWYDCDIQGEDEWDKLFRRAAMYRTRVRGFISNGNGCEYAGLHDGRSDKSIQLAAKNLEIRGMECWASVFDTDLGTKPHPNDPAIGSYFHVTERCTLANLKLGASNGTSAYLEPAMYIEYVITALDEQGRILQYWDGGGELEKYNFWRMVTIGTPLYTVNGERGSRSNGIAFLPDDETYTRGTFAIDYDGPRFLVGDRVVFSNVLNVIDQGGHTILTPQHPAKLWGYDTLRWKGNKGGTLNAPGPLTLTKADLMIEAGGAAYLRYCGFVRGVRFKCAKAAAGGKLKLSLLAYQRAGGKDLCAFALNSTDERYFDLTSRQGMTTIDGGEPDLNQYVPSLLDTYFGNVLNPYFAGIALADIPIYPRYY